MATIPSGGTLKGRETAGSPLADGERMGVGLAPSDEEAARDAGSPLGRETVLPCGDAELSGETELPATGVAVAGNEVGRGVGLGVGRGVGLGVGRGVGTGVGGGVGAVTTTCPGTRKLGFVSPVLVD